VAYGVPPKVDQGAVGAKGNNFGNTELHKGTAVDSTSQRPLSTFQERRRNSPTPSKLAWEGGRGWTPWSDDGLGSCMWVRGPSSSCSTTVWPVTRYGLHLPS